MSFANRVGSSGFSLCCSSFHSCVSTRTSGSTVTPLHVVRLNVGMIGASCDSLDATGIPDYSWLPPPTAPGADYYFRTYDGVLCSVTIRHLDVIDTGWSPVCGSSTREFKLFRCNPIRMPFSLLSFQRQPTFLNTRGVLVFLWNG